MGRTKAVETVARIRGVSSGAEVSARYGQGFRVRDGKLIYVSSFATLADALEALGLTEQDELDL